MGALPQGQPAAQRDQAGLMQQRAQGMSQGKPGAGTPAQAPMTGRPIDTMDAMGPGWINPAFQNQGPYTGGAGGVRNLGNDMLSAFGKVYQPAVPRTGFQAK